MKRNTLLFIGFLLLTEILWAQTDFRSGYIIKNSGDTVFGHIDYRSDFLMSSTCKFKDAANSVKSYSPNDLNAFRFTDGKYFISREINGSNVFLEYLIKGKVNIYYMRDNKGDHYYLDKEDVELTEIQYEEGIKYINDKKVFYESKKHIGLLSYYMQDAPQFQSRIQSVSKPNHTSLIKLAEDYHNTVCQDEQCIIYEKDEPAFRILPEIILGFINYSKGTGLMDKTYFQTGIIGHIWLPRASEKLYFRTGVLYSQLQTENEKEKENYYKIPLQLEYIYPKGTFRPRAAYGLNYYLPGYQSVSFNLGGNIKIADKCFLSLSSDIEFDTSTLLFPSSMLAYSIHFGLFIDI